MSKLRGKIMAVNGAQNQITKAVVQWPEITVAPHRFGGVEYQVGTREIGHIHVDTLVDIPFPTAIRNELVASGQVRPHHSLPDSGWISFYIRQPDDVNLAIELLQKSYNLAQDQAARRNQRHIANPSASQRDYTIHPHSQNQKDEHDNE
jgi:predicted DNA-binding protein (MmcQ/YjbR family)